MNLKTSASSTILATTLLLFSNQGFSQAGDSKVKLSDLKPDSILTNPGDLKLNLDTYLRIQSTEDEVVNSKFGGVIVEVTGEKIFSSYLSGRWDLGFYFMTGSYTNRYTAEGAPPSGTDIWSAIVDIHPTNWVSAEIGILDIAFSSVQSSFYVQGFPGIRANLTGEGNLAKVTLSASESIPTSSTPEVKSSESGINTTLNLGNLTVTTNPKETLDTTIIGSTSYFRFNNLTTSAASDSKYLGNTVTPVGSQARFLYQFEGYEYAAHLKHNLTKHVKLSLKGSELVNNQAPSGANKAQMVIGAVTYCFENTEVTASGGSFLNETDSLPASYVGSRYGYNNRFGWTAGLSADFLKQKSSVFGRVTQADVIDKSDKPYQADRQIVSLSVEVKYDIFK